MTDEIKAGRRTVRLAGFDYASASTYFVTICTAGRQFLFGPVRDDEMHLSVAGELAAEEWRTTLTLRDDIVEHAFVVMPNHMHCLFSLNWEVGPPVGAHRNAPNTLRRQPRSVGAIVSGYKGAVTRHVRSATGMPDFEVWQRGYHEHVVRNQLTFEKIQTYIFDNPARWVTDRENPANE